MKIFFVIHALNKGGAQRVITNLANSFTKLGHNIGIITLKSKKLDSYSLNPVVKRFELNLEGNKTTGINKFIINYKRLLTLRKIIKNESPDVVIAFMENSIVLSILASIGLPSKIFGSERNYPPDKKSVNIFWKLLRKLVYRFATGHITQTNQIKNWLNNFTGAKNIAIIPNPIVMPIPRTEPYIHPSSILPLNRKFILAVGLKTKQKGFDILINVFSKLSKNHPSWDLIIVGIDQTEDKRKKKYESILYLTEKLNITNRVHFPGRVGNIEDWYKAADLFVLSSR
jgi:glycosyltransferase involved in cell wall biosynthesis